MTVVIPMPRVQLTDPGGLIELMSVDAAGVREESISLALSFPDGVVRAVFTAFPLETEHPIEVRLTWTHRAGAWISSGVLINANERTVFAHFILHDLAHRLARFLYEAPDSHHDEIRAFAARLVPRGD